MRNYSWYYAIFHWFVHYALTIALVKFSTIIGIFSDNIYYYVIAVIFTTIIDVDHIQVFMKFKFKKYIWVQKRLVSPLHNFFSLSVFAIASAFSALFISKVLAVMAFVIVLHFIWDILEDVFIFRTSFRRWEKTWGLDKKDIEETYNELLSDES